MGKNRTRWHKTRFSAADVSTLHWSSEEFAFSSDRKITCIKSKMNKQYTGGITKLGEPTKKLRLSFYLSNIMKTKNTKWQLVKTKEEKFLSASHCNPQDYSGDNCKYPLRITLLDRFENSTDKWKYRFLSIL